MQYPAFSRIALSALAVSAGAGCQLIAGLTGPDVALPVDGGSGGSGGSGGQASDLCTNGTQDGKETAKDCGGGACPACALGLACIVNQDCQTLSCKSGVCAPAQCDDQAKNGDETDVDCGGPECGRCGVGMGCLVNADCTSEVCRAGLCKSNLVWGYGLTAQGSVEVRDLAATKGGVILAAAGVIDFGNGQVTEGGSVANAVASFDASGSLLWTKTFANTGGGWSADTITAIAGSAAGNVAMTGFFEGTVDFGNGSVSAGGALHSTNAFVVRLDASGNHVWSKSFGAFQKEAGRGITFDGDGNLFVTGEFRGTIDFGGGPLTSNADLASDVFLAKLSAAGDELWSARIGEAGAQISTQVVADNMGNAIVAGTFADSIYLSAKEVMSAGGQDVFIAKFAKNSPLEWSKTYGSPEEDPAPRLAIDVAGNVVLAGAFRGTIDLGGGPLSSAGGSDLVLAKLSASKGDVLWSHRFGDAEDQTEPSVAVGPDGGVFLMMALKGTVDFGGGMLTSAGDNDVVVAKFDTLGEHVWSRRFGNSAAQVGKGMAALQADSVVVAGIFGGELDFGGKPLKSISGADLFLARLLLP